MVLGIAVAAKLCYLVLLTRTMRHVPSVTSLPLPTPWLGHFVSFPSAFQFYLGCTMPDGLLMLGCAILFLSPLLLIVRSKLLSRA